MEYFSPEIRQRENDVERNVCERENWLVEKASVSMTSSMLLIALSICFFLFFCCLSFSHDFAIFLILKQQFSWENKQLLFLKNCIIFFISHRLRFFLAHHVHSLNFHHILRVTNYFVYFFTSLEKWLHYIQFNKILLQFNRHGSIFNLTSLLFNCSFVHRIIISNIWDGSVLLNRYFWIQHYDELSMKSFLMLPFIHCHWKSFFVSSVFVIRVNVFTAKVNKIGYSNT